MRVLHVIPSVAARYGGPSTVLRSMVEGLNRIPGVAAEVATTDANGVGGRMTSNDTEKWGAPVHLFRRSFSERWKFSAGLWSWLRSHADDYDIFHVHALWSFTTTAACSVARKSHKPVVLRPCGMLSPYTFSRSALRKKMYWWALEQGNVGSVSRLQAMTSAEAREIENLKVPGVPPLVVIPPGIESAAWAAEPRPHELRRLCGGHAGERPIVLFLSRLHPKKGITDLLLPAFARLKTDAFLAIAGGTDENAPGYEGEVRAAVQQLHLQDRVALLGQVESSDRWSILDGADLFVLPSHSENFGVVIIEAMARGIPVLTSNEVHSCEHVLAAGAGGTVPLDIAALADGMDQWLANPRARQVAGTAGRVYAADKFKSESIALRLEALYRDVLS
jgi:glycosyltransferase involved in cell wall biosynthesis